MGSACTIHLHANLSFFSLLLNISLRVKRFAPARARTARRQRGDDKCGELLTICCRVCDCKTVCVRRKQRRGEGGREGCRGRTCVCLDSHLSVLTLCGFFFYLICFFSGLQENFSTCDFQLGPSPMFSRLPEVTLPISLKAVLCSSTP